MGFFVGCVNIVADDALAARTDAAVSGWKPSVVVFVLLTIAAVGLAMIPLFLNEIPPLVDYPNHLARGVVLHGGGSLNISRFYVANWTVMPNVGCDVLLMGLLRLFQPALAGCILLGLVIVVQILGIVLYSRVAFGYWSWWSLGALLAAYNGLFLFGFINFTLSCGLAFFGAALWRAFHETRPVTATVGTGLVMVAIWFTHLGGAIFALLLLGAHETTVVWHAKAVSLRRRFSGTAKGAHMRARLIATRLPPTLVVLAVPLVLYLVSDIPEVSALDWAGEKKWIRLLLPIATYYPYSDVAVALAPVIILVLAAVRRRLKFDPASVLACAVAVLLFVVSPLGAGSIWWIDVRFALMVWMLVFASFVPTLYGRLLLGSTLLLAGAAVLKLVLLTLAWSQAGQDIADARGALGCVPAGARVISALSEPKEGMAKRYRELAFIHYGLYEHLGAWAVIDEDAFWPNLFALRGQQVLSLKPSYATTVPTFYEFESLLESGQGGQPWSLSALARAFDFVLVYGDKASALPPLTGLEIEARSGFFTLLRVAGSAAPKKLCRG
jgi:hypothetical protein